MQKTASTYTVVGLMSGTSLDGLDIVACTFSNKKGSWSFKVVAAETQTYTASMKKWLQDVGDANGRDLVYAHGDYGRFIGEAVLDFCQRYGISPLLVASHGHTLFHDPYNGMTFQLGDGNYIAAACKTNVVYDFRTKDVALSGQGAPLVPIGDQLLFGHYGMCINLGGFANVSFDLRNKRIAFDVCPVNIVINALAKVKGKQFDQNGRMARKGHVDLDLLQQLNALPYYAENPPKSLGKEWVESSLFPILNAAGLHVEDLLRTFTEHCAIQLSNVILKHKKTPLLFTGGGANNIFLMERIQTLTNQPIQLPPIALINFKEAIVFGFLGLLRYRNEINCLKSVTGAKHNHTSGTLVLYK